MTPRPAMISSIAVSLLLSACGQAQITNTMPGTKATAVEQRTWEQLTADADAALKRGNKAEAERGYKAAMTEAEKLAGRDLAQEEAIANLANFYYAQGDGGQADQLYKKNLALREKRLGMEHVDLTVDLLSLARVSNSEKKYAQASACYGRAIAILKNAGREVPAHVRAEYFKTRLSCEKSNQGI